MVIKSNSWASITETVQHISMHVWVGYLQLNQDLTSKGQERIQTRLCFYLSESLSSWYNISFLSLRRLSAAMTISSIVKRRTTTRTHITTPTMIPTGTLLPLATGAALGATSGGKMVPEDWHVRPNSFPAHSVMLYVFPFSVSCCTEYLQWSAIDDWSSLHWISARLMSIWRSLSSSVCLLTLDPEPETVWIVIVYFSMGRRSFLDTVHESVMVPSLNVISPSTGLFGSPTEQKKGFTVVTKTTVFDLQQLGHAHKGLFNNISFNWHSYMRQCNIYCTVHLD